MKTLKTIILSPWILSLVPFFIVVISIHQNFNRFRFEVRNTDELKENNFIWFEDLDNDGISERLHVINQQNTTALAVSNENGIIEQWNFRGNLSFKFRENLFITGDFNSDGQKEISLFTISSDSVFLNIIADLRDPIPLVRERFISVAGKGMEFPDPFIIPADMDDLDDNGVKELIFGIGSGFSKFPRNVFAYFIREDSLVMSPSSGYYIWGIMQADITGDGRREIIPYGYATSNINPADALYHDCSAFLMVLDRKMKFLFEPVAMGGKYSKITPFIPGQPSEKSIGFLFNPASSKEFSTVYVANDKGDIKEITKLPFYAVGIMNTTFRKRNNFLLDLPGKGIGFCDEKFMKVRVFPCDDDHTIIQDDFDSDGAKEILVIPRKKGEIIIAREGLLNPVPVPVALKGNSEYLVSIRHFAGSEPLISFQSGSSHYMLSYGRNPAYPLFWLLCLAIYSGILSFAMLIRKIQSDQLKKSFENEKKISQLQMALIRNQLDPHFTLNAINSIIYSVEHLEKDKAGDQLRRFANLYRNLLLSAGSNRRSIREELDFCSDYLILEKSRYGDKFSYSISVEDEVETGFLIPKMLIQLHVENAIKHGLAPLKSGGLLAVGLKKEKNLLLIEITDNGIGRERAAKEPKMTTGKGLEIMKELYRIYNRLYDEKIDSEILDIFDAEGHPAGTTVVIKISIGNG